MMLLSHKHTPNKLDVYWVLFLTSGVQEESVDCAVIFSSQLDLIALIWLGQVDPVCVWGGGNQPN